MTAIKYGDRFSDLRYDSIDLALVPQLIEGTDGIPDPDDPNAEFHQVTLLKGTNGKYGFSPNEMPYKDLSLPDSGIIVYEVNSSNVSLGSPLTQVRPAVGTQPGLTEYAVDFNNPFPYLNTGRFIFNPANVGKYYSIRKYYGLGGLNSVANTIAIQQAILNSKVSRDGSLAMTGDLNMGLKKIVSLLAGTNPSDAVNVSQLNSVQSVLSGLAQMQKGFINFVATLNDDVISSDAFVYRIASSFLGNSSVNITGCPNVDGTILFFENVNIGGAAASRTLAIHGQTVRSAFGTIYLQNVFANRSGGTWRLLTQ